jgi:molybdate transport system regulatory protein
MEKHGKSFSVRSKVWVVDEAGDVVFGLGRLKILEAVDRTGSILAAAKSLKMSYRAVWQRIRKTEERLGRPLLVKRIGGAAGGGSELTPFARDLVDGFRKLHRDVAEDADAHFDRDYHAVLKNPESRLPERH